MSPDRIDSTTVSFQYKANDGDADSNASTVTITINGVNDAAVTAADSASTNEDTAVNGTVVDNTTDADDNVATELTYSVVGASPPRITVSGSNRFSTVAMALRKTGPISATQSASESLRRRSASSET